MVNSAPFLSGQGQNINSAESSLGNPCQLHLCMEMEMTNRYRVSGLQVPFRHLQFLLEAVEYDHDAAAVSLFWFCLTEALLRKGLTGYIKSSGFRNPTYVICTFMYVSPFILGKKLGLRELHLLTSGDKT